MSSGIPIRKRDRIRRRIFGQSSKDSSNAGPLVAGTLPPPTDDVSQQFLRDAVEVLTEDEKSVIHKYTTSDINTTIQAACDAAEEQKTACKRKQWSGSDTADKVLVWLNRFKAVGDVVANADPVHVGLPWAGIRILLEVFVADANQMHALLNGMDLALCLANRLQAYLIYFQRLPPVLTTDNLRKALVALYAHVLRFLATAIRIWAANPAARKLRALWQTSDLEAFQDQSDRLEKRADIEANNCERDLCATDRTAALQLTEKLDTMLQKIDRLNAVTKSLDALRIKADLSKLLVVHEATYNSSSEDKLSLCLDGTRSEIMHSIERWIDRPDGKLIFWLCGMAGTGKSTISRTIANRLDRRQRLGASFFFKRGEQNRSNADYLFSTIASQLANLLPDMREPISVALDKESDLCHKGLQIQFEELLLSPLLSVDASRLPLQTVVIVIDALDECDQNTNIRRLLQLLGQLEAQSKLRLRIFLTSRPELPVQLGIKKLDGKLHQDVVLEEVQEDTIARDIRVYFDAEFAKIREDRLRDALPEDWPGEDDLRKLVDLAFPLFIFASTVCRFVAETKPRTRLKSVLAQRYTALPSHMAKTYLPILDHLLLDKQVGEQREMIETFRNIVGPIILAADPLSIASLASLLRIEPHDIDEEILDLLERLHSVLEIPPQGSHAPIRLLHLSFRDFLIDQERQDKDKFWIDEVETHKKLASCCLQRLCDDGALQMDICRVAGPGARRMDLSMQQIGTHVPPDVAYACSYWPLHVVRSRVPLRDDDYVHCFLQKHLLHWLEALSWLGRLSSVVAYMDSLMSIAQGRNCSQVLAFLEDCKRFILYNRHVIDLAPLQIYHSVMIFSPLQSIVRDTFCKQVPQLWEFFLDVPLCWSAEILRLEGHDDQVTAVAFSPDGQVIGSASDDHTLRLWNTMTGEQLQKIISQRPAKSITFSPNGQMIALASHEVVLLWNVATGEQIQMLQGYGGWFHAVAFLDGHVIASDSHRVRLWNTSTGEQTNKLEWRGAQLGVQISDDAMAFSSDGQVVALIPDGSTTVQLWNIATGKQTHNLKGHGFRVGTAAFPSDDRQIVASGSNDRTVRLWNTITGEQIRKFEGHESSVKSVAFSPDNKQMIASASHDGTIRIWDLKTGELTQMVEGHKGLVKSVAFSPDGQVIASASADSIVRLWNIITDEQPKKSRERNIQINSVALSPDGQSIASLSNDETVRLLDAATGKQTHKFQGREAKFSPDGRIIASASSGRVQLWNTTTGKLIHKLEGHSNRLGAFTFSPDGRIIAIAGNGEILRLWNTVTGEQMQRIDGRDGGIYVVAFSPDGQVIASASITKVRLWNVVTGEQMQTLEMGIGFIVAIAFSPDGQVIAASTPNGQVQLWNAATGQAIQRIRALRSGFGITFSPDGRFLETKDERFLLETPVSSSQTDKPPSLELRGPWIRYQGQDLLWLPQEYRRNCLAARGRTLVIGQMSGEVSIFRLAQDAISSELLSV